MKTTTMASMKKGLWHRLKRATDQEERSVGLETSIGGKRDGGKIEREEIGTN